MPYTLRKTASGKYRVSGPSGVHAKAVSKAKAQAQVNLLRAKEHDPNWKPTGKPRRKKKG